VLTSIAVDVPGRGRYKEIPARAPVPRMPLIPASFFAIVLGLAALGGGWRVAIRIWPVTPVIGEVIMLVAALVWLVLLVLYAAKWLVARDAAVAEFRHPVQSGFVSLVPGSTMLAALGLMFVSRPLALALFGLGAAGHVAFLVWRLGSLWQGNRTPEQTTPVLYLPSVAGNFIAAIVAGGLGLPECGTLFFGAGMLFWLVTESIVVHRLMVHEPLPGPLRPTMGILIAPPAVGCIAWLSINGGNPDLVAQGLFGYGLVQAAVLVRMLPWLRQPFGASAWAYTFGIGALAQIPLRFVQGGLGLPFDILAVVLFAAANLIIAGIALGTLRLLLRGQLLPPAPPPVAKG
jgi:tellurite resistance protein